MRRLAPGWGEKDDRPGHRDRYVIFSVLIEEGVPLPRHSLLESSIVAITPFEGVVSLPPIECQPDSRMTQCCEALFYCYIWF
ncbi:hypothetical protein HMPREF1979_02164 [Actinomyces johnsonii F0542]|uniref:Uncharacterized protein n=1 Tax=Actinomyces johnsonii F0542 TaxID=1321818 RepID=U1Q4I5_9ACTO|nr:hypothetical protein HMPREF1979_02164 [Actinomyces johnsonii F0542]